MNDSSITAIWLLCFLPWLMVAVIVAAPLAAVLGRNNQGWPSGVRVTWGSHWTNIRSGELRCSLESAARVTVSLLVLDLFAFFSVGVASIDWRWLPLFLPFLLAMLAVLFDQLTVRIVRIDKNRGTVDVCSGVVVPIFRRAYRLAEFSAVRIVGRKGVITGGGYSVCLVKNGKYLMVNSGSSEDNQQAYWLAQHIGTIAELPVF